MYVYTYHVRSKRYPFRSVTGRLVSLLANVTIRPKRGVYFVCLPPSRGLSLVKKGRFLPRANDRPKPGGLVQRLVPGKRETTYKNM